MPPIRSAHTRYLARHEAIQTDATNAAFANCSIELRVFILILVKSTRRAPNPPQMENTESNASSMVDVDSPHVSSVKNDYAGKTETEMKRLEREAEDAEKKLKHKFDEASENAEKGYDRAKKSAAKNAKSAEKKAKAAGDDLRDNQDNPVVIGNAVIIGLGSALLGYVLRVYIYITYRS